MRWKFKWKRPKNYVHDDGFSLIWPFTSKTYPERLIKTIPWLLMTFRLLTSILSGVVMNRVHYDPLKAAFHGFQNCSIRKALNPKSSLSILISKAQEPISKNQVLSLEIEKIFGNFFGLLPRDWTKIGGRFLTDHFNEKTDHFIWSMVFYIKIACCETY